MSHNDGSDVFNNYKKIWDQKIELIKNCLPIDVLFLYSDENIQSEYILSGDNLISKCQENYWSALLTKTINGFRYFKDSNYDLVFKTNLSTIVNFDKFYQYCSSLNCDGFIYEGKIGNHLDYSFCSGAGMLLNKNTVQIVLDNSDKINPSWTDDIFIGFILDKLNNIIPKDAGLTRFDILNDVNLTNDIKEYTHIRVKIRNNNKDIVYTNSVFDLIYKQ